ncbi:unnamed protein product, partial [Urochloa humidicola]
HNSRVHGGEEKKTEHMMGGQKGNVAIRKVNSEHFKTRFSMLRICELFPHFSNDHHPGVMVVVQGSPQVLQALHS